MDQPDRKPDSEVASDAERAQGGAHPREQHTPVHVLAAVIRRGDAYLVARRPAAKRHGGLWEFPGGKLLEGESWLDAARRELAEELDVRVTGVGEPRRTVRDPGSPFVIAFVDVDIEGEPRAIEHEALRWVRPVELGTLDLAPADTDFVRNVLIPDTRPDAGSTHP